MEKLNLGENYINDSSIESYEFREYTSTNTQELNKSGEVRIVINHQDLFLDISESYIQFKGQLLKNDDSEFVAADETLLINNALMYLFDRISYKASGQDIESLNYPGETTSMLGYLRYSEDFEKTVGLNQLWHKEDKIRKLYVTTQPNKKGSFCFSVPLKHIFGFCESYDKVMYGFSHELSLVRRGKDNNAIMKKEGDAFQMTDDAKVKLTTLSWFVPHVKPSLEYETKLLSQIKNKLKYEVAYKRFQDENITINAGTSTHDWRLSTRSSPEKPRFIILGLQKGNGDKSMFHHGNVKNIFVKLNSRRYPEIDYELDFENNQFSRMFIEANNFKRRCFMNDNPPNISPFDFKGKYPIFVIDTSNQSETIKGGVTDITVKINFSEPLTESIQAYAVVVSDRIVQFESDSSKMRVISD